MNYQINRISQEETEITKNLEFTQGQLTLSQSKIQKIFL